VEGEGGLGVSVQRWLCVAEVRCGGDGPGGCGGGGGGGGSGCSSWGAIRERIEVEVVRECTCTGPFGSLQRCAIER